MTSGIGRALAVAFAARGDTVIGCGRRLENLAALATELGSPGKHLLCQCDVANTSSVERFGLEVDARLPGGRGRVDLLICNAGVAIRYGTELYPCTRRGALSPSVYPCARRGALS